MADSDTPKPMDDGDIASPPATTAFEPAEPLKDAGVGFAPEGESKSGTVGQATQTVRENIAGFGGQASDKARQLAEDGKERVGGLLDQLAQMLTDAAGQVDDRLGAQYGDHARTAASSVQGFAQAVRDKDVDEFADDVRGLVRKSPAAALGIAAALGFAVARVVHAGLDQRA